jgi:Icc-related predicted phosphoesterase
VIRVAAIGDLHLGADSVELWSEALAPVSGDADLLLIAGDLTRCGTLEEAALVARVLRGVAIPKVAVLGNHDFHADQSGALAGLLVREGVEVLEGASVVFEVSGARVGVAGIKGFGGGFEGACGSEFGEPEMKAFLRHTRALANALEKELAELDVDLRIALLHYAPIAATLQGERLEIYPFLGSYLLGEAVDRAGADLVLHGHAHGGSERGVTPAGIRVRNVAQPVIKRPYNVYCFSESEALSIRAESADAGGCVG